MKDQKSSRNIWSVKWFALWLYLRNKSWVIMNGIRTKRPFILKININVWVLIIESSHKTLFIEKISNNQFETSNIPQKIWRLFFCSSPEIFVKLSLFFLKNFEDLFFYSTPIFLWKRGEFLNFLKKKTLLNFLAYCPYWGTDQNKKASVLITFLPYCLYRGCPYRRKPQ